MSIALFLAKPLDPQGKHEEADALLLKAIGIQENALGANHPALAISLYNRASVLHEQVILPSGPCQTRDRREQQSFDVRTALPKLYCKVLKM